MAPLTHDQLRTAYRRLLGREPESDALWSDTDAVSALLEIATSDEHERYLRQKSLPASAYEIARAGSSHFLTYTDDKVIGESLRRTGQFQEDAVETVLDLLKTSGHPVDFDVFVDVGANIGTHTMRALQLGFERAVCVEADKANFKLLRANQILNDVDGRCTSVLAAASSSNGHVTLEISPDNFGDHRVRMSEGVSSLHGETTWHTKRVPSRRLDDIMAECLGNTRIGLVWIDTQGHEASVLDGAPRLLASPTPLVVEFWPYGLSRSGGLEALLKLMRQRPKAYELRQSVASNTLIQISQREIKQMYQSMLSNEMHGSPHTDLLLV